MAGNNRKGGKGSEGLWIPNEIRNIPPSILDHLGKQVFAHIFTFGAKGCYQSNETMGEVFMVSARTIGPDNKQADRSHQEGRACVCQVPEGLLSNLVGEIAHGRARGREAVVLQSRDTESAARKRTKEVRFTATGLSK